VTRRHLLAALALTPAWPGRYPADVRSQPSSEDLVWLDIAAIRSGLAARTFSAVELTEAYLRHIERLNPALTAFVTVTPDRARADARRIDEGRTRHEAMGRLAGVPIAHKDLFETAGIRTTAGSRLYERHVPARDATLVARLAAAGTVMLGKCNTHELGGGVTTINPFFGTTRNPWDRTRVAGGSSGGSAAAVAAGLALAATGSDTGGSVRIPAAFCGCVGFKPTFGRIGTAGLLGAVPTFDHAGLLSRSVADLAALYPEAAGYGGRAAAALAAAVQVRPGARPSTSPLRVGIARRFFFDGLQPDVARAIEAALDVFRGAAREVRDVALPVDGNTMASVFDPIVVAEIHQRLGNDWRTRPDAFSPAFAGVFKVPPPTRGELDAAARALGAYQAAVRLVFERVDVIVTPTVPITAPPIAGPIDGALILRNTWPFNAARTPAISLPCGSDAGGLPVGLQLAAAPGGEAMLLQAASLYQRLTTWHTLRPG
jgi:aspartyl-tRNA(Asn)/glutamyl-tRNA(Gln) amidotransferase subunit A